MAVYKEDRVKVYGITDKTDLALALLTFPTEKLETWGRRMIDFQETVPRFELITCHAAKVGKVDLHLLYGPLRGESLELNLRQLLKSEPESHLIVHQPVDVLYLFGPHFQDRFGIIDIAVRALVDNNIDILVSGCAGTSMYFVTPKGLGQEGTMILSKTFLIPTTI